MRGNELQVSDPRWQHGSQIRFITFISEKSQMLKTQQPLKLEKTQAHI
jgi:hypothetical protein